MKRLICLILCLFVAGFATAGPLRYTLTGSANGTLDGVGFTGASITLSALGDPGDALEVDQGIWLSPMQQLSVVLTGQAPVYALEQVFFFVNQNNGTAGFLDQFNGDFLDFTAAGLAGFDGAHAFGPASASVTLLAPFATTGGLLELASFDNAQFTVAAAVVALPLPGSAWLVLAGLVAWLLAVGLRQAHHPLGEEK
ncbi:hypothetical protein ABT364_13435 [Massilia sp. SR12]